MKSLSELQSSPEVGPLERVARVCVAGKLVDQLDHVTEELALCQADIEALRAEAEQRREQSGRPRRSGETSRLPGLEEKADQLSAEADDLRARILDNSVEVRFAVDDGHWRQFVTNHPARDEQTDEGDGPRRYVDAAGYAEDIRWANGLCNVAALAREMRHWVISYNGEEPSEQWWEFLCANGAPGDLVKAASAVAGMHVNAVDPGKSRSDWLAGRRSLSGSE